MYMVTRSPGKGDEDMMQTQIYLHSKSLNCHQAASGEAGIEVAQAGLLLALYEHGHGKLGVAQITMAATSRLAIKLLNAHIRLEEKNIQNTELGRLWWEMVIIDR